MFEQITQYDTKYSIMKETGLGFSDFNRTRLNDNYFRKVSTYADFVVVKCNDTVSGYCAYYANDFQTRLAYITLFAIKKEMRGRGLGNLLMRYVLKCAKEKGMRRIRLEAHKDNISAIKFYFKNGFKPIDESISAFYMEKDLGI